jgi:NAD(P)-dependent dehydrogenase (short-subunit alcohol dehydrogenase family)
MTDLERRIALVTGAGSGIGAGIANVLARHGASLILTDIDESAARRVGKEATGSAKPLIARHDVRDPDSSAEVVALASAHFGRIDILVNNAGIAGRAPVEELNEKEWDSVFEVNVRGAFLLTRMIVPQMVERRSGRVINISSMVGKEGVAFFTHYCASKAAIIGMTQSLAMELAPHDITVNAICPGVIDTPLSQRLAEQDAVAYGVPADRAWQSLVARIPLKRPQTPLDIGEAAAFLASDRASNITGESLNVSGGMQVH